MMLALVNTERCTGCGVCVDACPQVFRISLDSAFAYGNPIPHAIKTEVRNIAANCLVNAIVIRD